MATATAEKETAIAPTKSQLVNDIMAKIARLQDARKLALPPNYSPENALMSAYLRLQNIRTKGDPGEPVLQACTQESIANSLVDMVIQGLSPAKNQCYFIPYGKTLTLIRSYMGTAAVGMRVLKSKRMPSYKCVFDGDQFEYEIRGGNACVTKHVQTLANINKDKIVGAYCTIYPPESEPYTEIMTIEEIRQAWKQSPMRPFDDKGNLKPDSTHAKFTVAMALKTVISRACKMAINTSDDSTLDLVVESFNRSDDEADEAAFEEEVAQNANKEALEAEWHEKKDEAEHEATREAAGETKSAPETPKPEEKREEKQQERPAPKQTVGPNGGAQRRKPAFQ